jgi:uncharacterized membrane protein YjgN (DUF898 family)
MNDQPPQQPPDYPPQYSQPMYPPQPSYPSYQQPDWRLTGRPMNHKAHQAQLFGLLGLLLTPFGIVAVILGFMALSEIQMTGEDGSKQAKTGVVLGFVEIAAMLLYYLVFLAP